MSHKDPTPRLLTKKDVQQQLQVSATTLNRYIRLGEFPNIIRRGQGPTNRLVRIPETDLNAFLSRHTTSRKT